MIEFKNVSVAFQQGEEHVDAVRKVSLSVGEGSIYGIVGGSGAGKSTLLRTINGLQPTTDGEVIVGGQSVSSLGRRGLRTLRSNIGMIFQHFNLAESKTVCQNISFMLEAAGWEKSKIDARITELLEYVNISDKRDAYPGRLSGGQKQRVAIARALANHTKILLCDEPTSALDAETTASVLELLKKVNRDFGVTIVIITHELDVVKSICDEVAVMNHGEVVESGPVYDVFTQPKSDFTRQLIAHTQNYKIPEEVWETITGKVLKIVYQGNSAVEPVLSDTSSKYRVGYNILHGKIEYIASQPTGVLYVNLIGAPEDIDAAEGELRTRVAELEVIHHVF